MFAYEIGETRGSASFGDLVICPPGIPFRRVIIPQLTFHHFRFAWQNEDGTAIEHFESPPTGKITILNSNELSLLYEKMQQSLKRRREHATTLFNYYLNGLWYLYCEEIVDYPEMEKGVNDDLARQALQWLQAHAFQSMKLHDLSPSLQISPSQLTKRFFAAYRITPAQYLTSLRLEKVSTLLRETTLRLDEIAECSGYQNSYYLNRVFTIATGKTPGQYRRMNPV